MSRLKKYVAGALAVVLCATSIAAKAPAQAEAAAYCNHTIYKAGTSIFNLGTEFCCKVSVPGSWYNNGTQYKAHQVDCKKTTYLYVDKYQCYNCRYTYSIPYHVVTHSHSH